MQAQATFWTENFGTGCNRGQLATAYSGSNGNWTIANTGTNGNVANTWFISATSANTGSGNCADNCNFTNATNRTLHVGNATLTIPMFLTVGADTGANYLSGGYSSLGYVATSNQRVESPLINCSGQNNITLSFIYLENGQASLDDAQLVYSPDGGTTWTVLDALAKTTGNCTTGQWTTFSIALPTSANNNATVKIGFTWTNNDDGQGTDPSFSVDDITLSSSTTTGVSAYSLQDIQVYASGKGQITVNPNGNVYKPVAVYNIVGQEVTFTQNGNTLQMANAVSGVYIVNLMVNGKPVVRKIILE
ncbi:MAG: hypothetical protein Fur0041_04640 [Bacteroidia bacterium]